MSIWREPQPVDVPDDLRQAVGGHPLVAETLARRGILTSSAARPFLDPNDYHPASPSDLPDLSAAVVRICRAIDDGEQIAVWGDFDADGQTSTALLVETLRTLGADVVFRIPSRQEGHGLHKGGMQKLIAAGTRLILTCDTGITAHTAVAMANSLGADVIITDHHTLPRATSDVPDQDRSTPYGPAPLLPPAQAVVNPHRLPPDHPLHTLTGVGVAYQLARGLDPEVANRTLDLVALGTVADVGTLTGESRYLVQRGLEALRHSARPGLQALYQVAQLRPEGLTEEHIGFSLGPRLNALGRLADATQGVELLLTGDPTRARILATEMEGLNARRKWLTKQITGAALTQIQREPALLSGYNALVLSHPTWPGGVIGIVASRLAERFGKPVVLISAPPDQIARGSGRSIPGIDLIASLGDCATSESGIPLFKNYGGHPGAAGFGIDPERIPEFRVALSRALVTRMETVPKPTLNVDAFVDLPDLTLDLVASLNRLAPFGQGNPPVVLAARNLRVQSQASIGRTGEHRRLVIEDTHERTQTVFWWHGAGWPLPRGHFDLAVTIRASDYRGAAEVQVQWLDARDLEPTAVEVQPRPSIEVVDLRRESDPQAKVQELFAKGDVQVWAEGQVIPGLETRTRLQLDSGPRLAVWTVPPGPRELQAALERVQPEQLLLFSQHPFVLGYASEGPRSEDEEAFLKTLAGMAKFALRSRGGQMELEPAAAKLAHRVNTLVAGLDYLAAQGILGIVERGDDRWQLSEGTGCREPKMSGLARATLGALLAETAAYRAYFRSVPASALIQS